MPKLSVIMNGRSYDFVCDEGQEEHLKEMALLVDRRIKDLVLGVGQIGEVRLLAMAALLLADELSEAYRQLDAKLAEKSAESQSALESLAGRIDQLAARLYQA